jgi:hypothetical protein
MGDHYLSTLFQIVFPLKIVNSMNASNLWDLTPNSTNDIECKTTQNHIKWKHKSNLFIFQILVNDCFASNDEYLHHK